MLIARNLCSDSQIRFATTNIPCVSPKPTRQPPDQVEAIFLTLYFSQTQIAPERKARAEQLPKNLCAE